jgi:GH24 family phage-related lysozyme (muramidase)
VKTSREGIQFIAGREALVLVAYEDGEFEDGSPRYSIGFGDNGARKGDKIDPKTAWKHLVANVRVRENIVNKYLKKPVTQHQYDAIMSAFYQGGTRNLLPLVAAVNAGQADQIPDILPALDTNRKGEHKPGLRLRREPKLRSPKTVTTVCCPPSPCGAVIPARRSALSTPPLPTSWSFSMPDLMSMRFPGAKYVGRNPNSRGSFQRGRPVGILLHYTAGGTAVERLSWEEQQRQRSLHRGLATVMPTSAAT